MKHTTLSPEKAKGSPNIWISSGGCGWPAAQMFADMRTSHGLLASVAGQLLPLHHTDILLRPGFIQCLCADVATHCCASLFVCLLTCHHSYIKITPLQRITEWHNINLTLKVIKVFVSSAHMQYILMWNMWTQSVNSQCCTLFPYLRISIITFFYTLCVCI